MPISKIKGNAINDGAINTDRLADSAVTVVKTNSLFENTAFTGDDGIVVPKGTTAERPASPTVGEVRFNTTLDQLEQYTNDSGWQGISPPPVVTSVDVNSIDSTAGTQTIVITGTNFDTSAVGVLVDANGATKTATTSTRNSSTQITIVYSGGDVIGADVPEPLDVKVTNGSGLAATLEDVIGVDDNPVWTTAAGSLGTVYEDEAISTITLQATDPETGGSITYTVTSGSLPTGLSLNSSTGAITGTPNVNDSYNASGVTHNFSVTATGADSDTTVRAFSILRKWYDGSTAELAATSGQAINDLGLSSGVYYIKPDGYTGSAIPLYVLNGVVGGGWLLISKSSRNQKFLGNVTNSQIMSTDDYNIAELQQNRHGDYHARVNWLFLNKLQNMSNCRKAARVQYTFPSQGSGIQYAQKLNNNGRGTNSSGTTAQNIGFDIWYAHFAVAHWGTVSASYSPSDNDPILGGGTEFSYYNSYNGQTPTWNSTTNLLTGTQTTPAIKMWDEWYNAGYVATGTYANQIGNNGKFHTNRHTGILGCDHSGGNEWIYTLNNSGGAENNSGPAYETVWFK